MEEDFASPGTNYRCEPLGGFNDAKRQGEKDVIGRNPNDVPYRRILCATDGSEYSLEAGREAAALARLTGARLLGLYVLDTLLAGYGGLVLAGDILEALRREGEKALADLEQVAAAAGVPFEAAMAEGVPKIRIPEAARERGADLLVVGSHGRTGLTHLLLGSVAEAVVRHAPCDVLVVRRRPPRAPEA